MARRHDKGEEAARLSIIEAAASSIALRGAAGASLSEIAAAAKISKGTLNYYYTSKDLLLLDVAAEHISRLTRVLIDFLPSLTRLTLPHEAAAMLGAAAFPEGDAAGEFSARLHLALLHDAVMRSDPLASRFALAARQWSAAMEVGVLKARADSLDEFSRQIFAHISALAAGRASRRVLNL